MINFETYYKKEVRIICKDFLFQYGEYIKNSNLGYTIFEIQDEEEEENDDEEEEENDEEDNAIINKNKY